MRAARRRSRSGWGRRPACCGRLRVAAAALLGAVLRAAFAGGAVAQYPGKNGILTWSTGYRPATSEHAVQGIGHANDASMTLAAQTAMSS